jgi:hypothetical protein
MVMPTGRDIYKVRRGLKSTIPVLEDGEPGFTQDEKALYIGTASGNVRLPNQDDIAASVHFATVENADPVSIQNKMSLQLQIDDHTAKIADNEQKISENTQKITDNTTQINSLSTSLTDMSKLNIIDVSKPPKESNISSVIPDGTTDNRPGIQAIIDYAYENDYKGIYIPPTTQNYRINVNHTKINQHLGNGLQIPSNFKLIIHPDAVLEALPTTFTYHVMLNIYDAQNVEISGGTLLGERSSHGNNVNQFGYGLYVWGSSNVTVKNITSKNWWGDCFATRDIDTDISNSYLQPCKNILFDGVLADNACRNGLSVISGKNVIIKNSEFNNANGTNPQAGIDLEPNYMDDSKALENIIIDNCKFSGSINYSIATNNKTKGLIIRNCKVSSKLIYIKSAVQDVSIKDNLCDTGAYISVESQNTILENNTIRNGYGLNLANVFDDTLIVKDNKMYGCTNGLIIMPGSKNMQIHGNYISGCTGNSILTTGGTADNIEIVNNKFVANNGHAYIRLANSLVDKNEFVDNQYSIWHDQGSSTVIQNNVFRIINNPLLSLNFITIASVIVGSIVDGNKMYASNADSVDPLAITANTGRSVPIVVRNNVSMKTTTIFTTPPAGTVMANNYSA